MKTEKTYETFEYDGAVYRREAGFAGVSEVRDGKGAWKPYTGDRMKPVTFGERVEEA